MREIVEQGIERTAGLLMEKVEGTPQGNAHWEGSLSDSALSTSLAVLALSMGGSERHDSLIQGGLRWLRESQNADGGWGDTLTSLSNFSTSLLVWCALSYGGEGERNTSTWSTLQDYLTRQAGGVTPEEIVQKVLAHYGEDKTFSAPILSTCALAGCIGPPKEAWDRVPQLPFEIASLPHGLLRLCRLPVVSYAIPALIAVGLVAFRGKGERGFPAFLRRSVTPRCLRVLEECQPENGGFLEAIPLTSFVVLSLIGAGESSHPVVQKGLRFLEKSARFRTSWPIDTHLATWVTTSAVTAFSIMKDRSYLEKTGRESLLKWILSQQFTARHPFTGAAPGGWAWTPLPGGVPDADDTSGALVALHHLAGRDPETRSAAEGGIRWLIGLQNRDGGIPTFCRGWGRLPFDRSCPDITAHAIKALNLWLPDMPTVLAVPVKNSLRKASLYLQRTQDEKGSWIPLWFGNENTQDHTNPTYGTSKVILGCPQLPGVERGRSFLAGIQNKDGGWGGGLGTPSSIEETALAIQALSGCPHQYGSALEQGLLWLKDVTRNFQSFPASPIGLYFSSLWYAEELYPILFTLEALGRLDENLV